ncbi:MULTISPECIES: hypothetical protein [Streptomyces]|uniref:Uncharacterized protein n=1 Tax=Streptomyces glycanivorans TaxID=3033808 RepID=A0ABY9JF47_9ACTN|nr:MULTISPECIES: hypothetical protein [unclassified Streptomyces]WSQ79778.1 hypothetical protein OG725_22955 [Streptomyces sp. NBC_01213]TXS09059.1 hypothetical protein EAO68_33970 [Streptomyces sp. wa22]WLQ66330.1 hypothetical protein P8A20_23360 [Streptomyces sp. Alt3]WSQ87158.1 hypothetical protein OG722_23635 [Streptomyces sp. NBC_01212]WSR06826.1 hypothetical protein OG265_12785 [Streptomyces sp. NBC_01208]
MQIAGFFQELWAPSFGQAAGSVQDFVMPTPYTDAKKITEYLLAGHDIFSVMGSSRDVLGSGKTVLGGDSILSDNEWIWRGDLWFYVWNHRVQLPGEFLARLRANNYEMPAENEQRLTEIARYVQSNL